VSRFIERIPLRGSCVLDISGHREASANIVIQQEGELGCLIVGGGMMKWSLEVAGLR
jgi:deoxyhypusine synthase